ncbi:hypothetical protein BK666_24435 [Pseudomonas frederiksbergensis]|uniref:Uncharacterized protein n=1 Tax=Pseudomonas frederiksbergensis TaxID=104087 RepID=A0A423JUY2_9PSED|nr:hypothetical protein [Pseudomonas frederiksbergensis]RON41477.1 hypothetical protein BK666_24435 [Pseudomonas frederiksbergensis]
MNRDSINNVIGTAKVVNTAVICSAPGPTKEEREFVKNCLLLAQREADQTYSEEKQIGRWFDYFADMMWKHGWSLDSDAVELVKPSYSGNIQNMWSEAVSDLASGPQIEEVERVIALVEQDARLFSAFAEPSGKMVRFELVPMGYNSKGDLEVVISHVRIIKSTMSTTYLFWRVHQHTSQLDIRGRRLVIKRRVADARRKSVEDAVRGITFTEFDV